MDFAKGDKDEFKKKKRGKTIRFISNLNPFFLRIKFLSSSCSSSEDSIQYVFSVSRSFL